MKEIKNKSKIPNPKSQILNSKPSSAFSFTEMVKILKGTFLEELPAVTKISKTENRNPFLVLVGTLLSLRTKDEITEKVMEKLTKEARTPEDILKMNAKRLQTLIYPVGFYRNKTNTLKNISRIIIEDYNGKVPDSIDELLKIKGIGRKTANLVITEAYGKPGICVDTHVHRISNRLGIIKTKNPHETEDVLRNILPKKFWIIYNTLLVTFGKKICNPISPRCSKCTITHLCLKIGVTNHR